MSDLVKRSVGEVASVDSVAPLLPRTAEEVGAFVDAMIKFDAVPSSYSSLPEAKRKGFMVVAILKGMELGMPPLRALQSIYVVNGVPTIYGDALVAYVMRSGLVESYREWFEGEGDQRAACVCAKRIGVGGEVTRSFSVAMAQRMNLLGKKPWQHSRDRMLMIRARTYVFRDLFADALDGLGVAEEQEDIAAARGLAHAASSSGDTRAIDPLADTPVIEGEFTPSDSAASSTAPSDGAGKVPPPAPSRPVAFGSHQYDPASPEALPCFDDFSEGEWRALAKALRTLIERAPDEATKRAWARINQGSLLLMANASPALRSWTLEPLESASASADGGAPASGARGPGAPSTLEEGAA